MESTFRLGRIFGIPFGINYSWFAVFIVVTFSLASIYYPDNYPGWGMLVWWGLGFATSLLFFGSVLAHELAHSAVSTANGIPVHGITLFIFGGVAKISREAHKPSIELTMALAGPACSAVLAVVFGVTWWLTQSINEPVAAVALSLAAINASLALFNMIPGFPLDGGRVLRSLVWKVSGNFQKATKIAASVGRIAAYGFIFAGILAAFYRQWDGLWFVFVGWFLDRAALDSYRQVAIRDVLKDVKASDLISYHYRVVPTGMTIDELAQEFNRFASRSCCLVVESGRLIGLVTAKQVEAIPEHLRLQTTVLEAMTPWEKLEVAKPEDDVVRIWDLMQSNGGQHVPLMDGSVFVGLVDDESLNRYLSGRHRFWKV
ncbi:MAG: site-2 protease family protein [Chloroflexi bacterium]|nr:site-2 protease family protein [Chloroflexota bacterium]